MDTYHAAYWSSDPFRLSSSDEEEDDRDNSTIGLGLTFVINNSPAVNVSRTWKIRNYVLPKCIADGPLSPCQTQSVGTILFLFSAWPTESLSHEVVPVFWFIPPLAQPILIWAMVLKYWGLLALAELTHPECCIRPLWVGQLQRWNKAAKYMHNELDFNGYILMCPHLSVIL